MKKNEEKIFLGSIFSLILLVGAGCMRTEQNNVIGTNQNPSTSTKYDVANENKNNAQKKFTIDSLTMTVPDKYSVGKIKGSKVWIKTDDKKYDVKLVLEITPMTTVEFKKATAGLTPDAVLKNGSVYKEGCSGFGCYNMMVGEKAFAVQSTIESNEKAPLNLDGVWSPSTIATSQDLLSILKTVEVK
jgi:hypothetical protein